MHAVLDSPSEVDHLGRSAAAYTLIGSAWALMAMISAPSALRSLIFLGAAVALLLLSAQLLRVIRSRAEILPLWDTSQTAAQSKGKPVLRNAAVGVAAGILIVSGLLWVAGKPGWIVPASAVIFAFHFYLLPAGPTSWLEMLLASGVVIASVAPILSPSLPGWEWAVIASSACSIASWLAADIRLQLALHLLKE